MARVHLDPDLDVAVRFEAVALSLAQVVRHRGGGRRQQLRRLAGETKRTALSVFEGIDLDIPSGQAVAVLGRRNAGAIELLRLAAGTLIPDVGHVHRRDLVVPVIDGSNVLDGAITVRQNVYQVGALLGMTPEQVSERLDWIVEFAELRKFMDGYLRHAPRYARQRIVWTVSMATRARIFAIEKALVVGNEEFEAKCWAHVEALKADGVTFLVEGERRVPLERFCDRGIVLSEGRVAFDGTVADAFAALATARPGAARAAAQRDDDDDDSADEA